MEKTDRSQHDSKAAAAVGSADDNYGVSGNFRRLVGYTTDIWIEGYSEIGLVIRADHMNSLGFVHGGIYATLLDAAFGHVVAYCAVPGHMRQAVTTSLTTTYLSSSKSGRLMACGRLLGVNGRVATVNGEVVHEDGTVCARGQASFLYFPGSEKPDGIPKPKRPAKS